MTALFAYWRTRPTVVFLTIAGALTLLRIAALIFAEIELGPDEAQYWFWSREPAFGYYSKPPLIAWLIATSVGLFGDSEWAVRLPAPLLHFGTACILFALARRLYGATTALWSGLGWIALPGVSLSAMLMTTDAPLLFFWALGLYLFFRLLERPKNTGASYALAAGLGAAIGLGLLSKYAMIYFLVGAGLSAALVREARTVLLSPHAGLSGIVALAILAPNIMWNAENEFGTIAHTAANANWTGDLFRPAAFAAFFGAQFGVFGPVLFALLLWGLATLSSRLAQAGEDRRRDLVLLAFALPPLVIVGVQALISRAHANWAAAAFPAAVVLATVWALRARLRLALVGSAAIHAGAALAIVALFVNLAAFDALGLSNAVKKLRGWDTQAAALAEIAAPYDAVITDDRELMGSLLYYMRGRTPIAAWDSNRRVDNHYEAFFAYDAHAASRALYVSLRPDATAVTHDFSSVTPAGEIAIDIGREYPRTLYLFAVSDYAPSR